MRRGEESSDVHLWKKIGKQYRKNQCIQNEFSARAPPNVLSTLDVLSFDCTNNTTFALSYPFTGICVLGLDVSSDGTEVVFLVILRINSEFFISFFDRQIFRQALQKVIHTSFQQFFILYCPESNLNYCFPLYFITKTEKKSIAAFCHGKIRLYLQLWQ